jgi:hypothetical protein
VHLVFSGIIPKNTGLPAEMHPTWQQAELFGASISNVVKHGVTHVVTQTPGTDKTMSATKLGIFIVSPLWLERSISMFRRCPEMDFSFTGLEIHRKSQGYPVAGSGAFVAAQPRVVAGPSPAAVAAAAEADKVSSSAASGVDVDYGLSMAAWRDAKKNVAEEEEDDEDEESSCVIDNLMSSYF